jgi:hypothetical protein
MRGRRRDERYRLSAPFEGALSLFQDVIVERCHVEEVVALSDAPGDSGEVMTLDLISSGPRESLQVRLVESAPVIVDGGVRYRLRLAVVD